MGDGSNMGRSMVTHQLPVSALSADCKMNNIFLRLFWDFIRESCWCLPGLSSASACQCLSSELNRCLPRSVSQCLLPNLSRGVTWCLSGSAQCLSLANVCLMGLIGVLSELALTCLSANVYDENPADVFLDWALRLPMSFQWAQSMSSTKCLPMSFAKSVWRSHLMSFWISPMSA